MANAFGFLRAHKGAPGSQSCNEARGFALSLIFDPLDPFPLLSSDPAAPFGAHSYVEAQEHSALVDNWLGIKAEAVEEKLSSSPPTEARDQQLWIGLPLQKLQTPYCELRSLFEFVQPRAGQKIVDLGAAYGRIGFVLTRHFPACDFTGYEYVGARVRLGQAALSQFRNALPSTPVTSHQILQADLSSAHFTPAPADIYFLYDFGSRQAIEKILQDLREVSVNIGITVVGRGRASRDAIDRGHPWLAQVVPPRHFAHYSVYRSRL